MNRARRTDGVLRFIMLEHAYGKDMRGGAMVGYLQRITVDDAYDAVNAAATASCSQHHYTTAAPTARSTRHKTPPLPKPGFPHETSRWAYSKLEPALPKGTAETAAH
ncbi:MAG: hypothetical protein WBP81_31210 [Solirubrobacteraceae bacterium]